MVAAAGAVLAVGVAVWAFGARRASPLTDRDAILLADVENKTGDPVFDDTIKTAIAVGLEQSPFLAIVPDDQVRETLRLSGRDQKSPVTREVAHDLCQRDAIKAVLTGSITALGSHYVIALDAQECRSGVSLAREQVEAESKEQVVNRLGRATANLRSKLGESLASVQKFDAPIERVTTSSLEALKAYSTGMSMRYRLGAAGELESVPFFNRAIELDPDFALAYHYLARIHQNQNRNLERARHFASEAFARRDRVSDFERLSITAAYHYTVSLDWDKAIEAFEVYKQRYPRAAEPANNVGVVYAALGMSDKALASYEEGVRRGPLDAIHISNLAGAYAGQNRYADAKRVFEGAVTRHQIPRGIPLLYEIAFVEHDDEAMKREFDAARGRAAERALDNSYQGVLTFGGRYRAARELLRSRPPSAGELRTAAEREALAGNDAEARRLILEALAKEVAPQGRADAAVTLALIGESDRAQQVTDEIAAQYPEATSNLSRIVLPTARAALALRRGDAAAAVALLSRCGPTIPRGRCRHTFGRWRC